ncbi:hypothetical protein GCM10022216_32150 [Sphingobacterium kyonggiense]|uniref:Glucosyltransferase 3-like C-terminal domain-containing protein n=1 Tax=Sphingobacterium kyonggiense TaxID=714075 RepID=A0ABP7Z4F4_9SPHI
MRPILYVKGTTEKDVRLSKFLKFFNDKNIQNYFIGWNRNTDSKETSNIKYIFNGGGKNNKYVMFYYPFWMLIVFFHFLFKKNLRNYNLIAVNFDTAFPIYLVSKFRKFEFIYEIYDQFAISYNFPKFLKKLLLKLDERIMDRAKLIIHVDSNRVNSHKEKSIVIENTPNDFYKGSPRSYEKVRHKFAVTGLLNKIRGIDQILKFAQEYPHIEFLFVGEVLDEEMNNIIQSLNNIKKYNFMPQEDLFALMQDCCGIFSLYNPKIEINRLAASNKVYDAMMLGIPVITNSDVINSKFIKEKNIGLVINYIYDKSWQQLADSQFVSLAQSIGENGRAIYLEEFEFNNIVDKKLVFKLNH